MDSLGWWEFERLCQALLQAAYGVVIEAWGGSSDDGRDAYSEANLEFPAKGQVQPGPFVFQAKFVQEANAAGADPKPALKKAVAAELARIERRKSGKQWKSPRCYVLMTNAPLTKKSRNDLTKELQAKLPKSRVVLCGERDLSNMLDDAKNIRTSFPQLLGIQDLQTLIEHAIGRDVGVRGDLLMKEAADLAPVFVPTGAYTKALNVLGQHNFVVLTGPPEMGKTSIALMVALARLGDGWEVFDCAGPEDFFKAHLPDRRQVFIADDAFGSTEYTPDRATRWAYELHKVLRAIDYRHWLIWTSRPAPLRLGLRQLQLQGGAERFPEPGEIQVDATKLKDHEKALILYKHCKVASLDDETKELARANARPIIENDDFTPERIRRLVKTRLTELAHSGLSADVLRREIAEELEQSTDRMTKSFDRLDLEHKRLLVSMLDAAAGLITTEQLSTAYVRHAPDDGDTPVPELIGDLAHHFIRPLR